MNKSIHFRFASYVFAVTAIMLGFVISCFWDFSNPYFLFFMMLLPYARKLLGPSFKGWHERDCEVSNRSLVIGFFICLALVWGGGIAIAHSFSPRGQAPKYLLWIMISVLWLVSWLLSIYPAYQWWRVQKIETQSAA